MPERLELVVNVAGTGLATLVGADVGGLIGAEVGAVLPIVLTQIARERSQGVEEVAQESVDLAGLSAAGLLAWVRSDTRHASLFVEALEAAWETLDAGKRRTLAYVLADGMQDDARLDVDQLLLRVMRKLEPVHIRMLGQLTYDRSTKLSESYLKVEMEPLADGLPALVADLVAAGCLYRNTYERESRLNNNSWGTYHPPDQETEIQVTDFGKRLLEYVKNSGGEWGTTDTN